MKFYDKRDRLTASLTLRRTCNGECMLQNKVLKDTSSITPAVQTILHPIQVKRMSRHLTTLRSDPVLQQDEPMEVQIVNMAAHPNPKYATEGVSGMDLCANVTGRILLAPNQWVLIPTGIHIALLSCSPGARHN